MSTTFPLLTWTEGLRYFVLLVSALGLTALGSPERAQAQSFQVSFSSSEAILAHPNDPLVMHYESWDSPLGRILKRNRPFIQLENTSAAVALSEFSISIGDIENHFGVTVLGAPAVLGTTTPAATFTSQLTDASGTPTGNVDDWDLLTITFDGGGLAAGEVARFQVDLDVDSGFPNNFIHPDYRTVFFQPDDDGLANNSTVTATFANDQTASQVLPDMTDHPIFMNGAVRPYDTMENIEVVTIPDTVVPEPASLGLLALGAMACVASGSVRRARQR